MDDNAIVLGNITATGTLSVTAGGAAGETITDTGTVDVDGTTTLNSGLADIVLDTVTNDFTGAVTASGANITLVDANAIVLGTITASGDLSVTALGGTITDTGTVNVDGTTNLSATSDIVLDTVTNDFTGAVTASGADITLVDANAIVLEDVTGTGTVTITALNGNITEDSDATADVTANAAILSATGGGINVDTDAVSVAFTATGNVFIDEVAAGGDLSVSGLTTANNGNIDIETLDGTLTVGGPLAADGSGNIGLTASDAGIGSNNDVIISGPVTSTSGDITILADNSITLTAGANVLSTSTTVGDIVLTATDGAITGTATNLITGSTLAMTANTGIGNFDVFAPIYSAVSTLAAATEAGDIAVINIGGLTIGTIGTLSGVTILDATAGGDNSGDDHIAIGANSPLTVNAAVVNNDGGDIYLASFGLAATDDLTINANVTALGGDGDINMAAGHNVTLNGTTVISAANAGDISISAGVDATTLPVLAAGHASGSVSMIGSTSITSGSGQITLTATNNVVVATVSTSGNVTVSADDDTYGLADGVGYIRESKGGETANITANVVTLTAATGIGEDDDIELNATSVSATNSTSGDIRLNEVAAGTVLTLTGASNAADGNIDIRTENGSLTVTGAVVTSGSGMVDLVAGDSDTSGNGDLILQSTVGAEDGDITLTSEGNDVTFTAAADITTTTGSIEVRANAGAITMTTPVGNGDGTVINAGSGVIDLHSEGDITLGRLVTTNATDNAADNAIMISTSVGDLIDGGDFGGADIQATGGLTLNIAGSIGIDATHVADPAADAAIETSVASLTVTAGGGVAIDQTGSVVLDMNVAGDITVTVTDGTLTANSVVATGAGSDIVLTTQETAEVDASNVNLIVGTITAADDTVTLNSADAITQQAASAGVTTADLFMTVQGGIGASGAPLMTTVDTITAASTNMVDAVDTAADMFITETDDVTLTSVTTANGNITVIAGGSITADLVAANTAGNNVTLTANGAASDILLGSVTATGGTATITAGDEILDNLVAETANVTASTVDLNAAAGIGTALEEIDLVTTTLTADTTAGVINLANVPGGTVTINSMTTADASDITYKQTGQNLIIAGAISSGGGNIWIDPPVDIAINANVTTTGAGTILIQGTGAISTANGVVVSTDTGTLTIAGVTAADEAVSLTMADDSSITSSTGDITLRANTMTLDNVTTGGDVLLDSNAAAGAVITQLAGTPGKVTADNLTIQQDAAGNILVITNVASLDVVNGATVTVREDNDIVINSVATVTSFLLNAENGEVTGNGGNDVTATNLEIRAANGITLNTAVANLAVDNTTSGNVAIVEADGVTLGTALGNTNAADVAAPAQITNLTHSQVFRNQVADGLLTLSTTNGPINTSTAAVTSNGGIITFTANDTSAPATQLANITVGTGNIVSNDGNINLYAADSVALGGNVNAGSGDVNIEANSANETTADNIGAITRTAGTVTGESLDLMAATGIGVLPSTGATAIYTNADFISAMNTNAGNISINELNGVTLTGIDAANGSIDLTAGGTIIVLGAPGAGITATGGSVTLDANGVAADILVSNAVTATGGVTMTADNDIMSNIGGTMAAGTDVSLDAGNDITLNDTVDAGDDIFLAAGNNIEQAVGADLDAGSDVVIDASGTSIVLNGPVTAGNDILIGENDASASVTINGLMNADNDITINSDDFVHITAAVTADADMSDVGDLTVSGADEVTATAALSGVNVYLESTGSYVTLAAVTATGGDIMVDADTDVTLNGALNADNHIMIFAGNDILSNVGGTMNAGSNVDLAALNDITLNATVDAGNNIYMMADNDILQNVGAAMDAVANIYMDALNDITLNATMDAGNNIYMEAGENILISGEVEAGNDIVMEAIDERIEQYAGSSVIAVSDITMTAGTTITFAQLDAGDNLTATSGTVNGSGGIMTQVSEGADPNSNIQVGNVTTLVAGLPGDMADIILINADNDFGYDQAGDVFAESYATRLNYRMNADGADISIHDSNTMWVGAVTGNAVMLSAYDNLLDANDPDAATPVMNITASVSAILRAETGTIGEHVLNVGQTTTNPIEIDTPVVYVASANTNALIYANLSGTVDLNTILMENPWPYGNNFPQGTWMLNGQMIYPIQVPGVNSRAELAEVQASLGLTLIGGDGAQGIGAYPQPASVVGSTLETLYSTQAPARLFNSRDPQSTIFEPIITISGSGIAVPMNVEDDEAAARRRRMAKK